MLNREELARYLNGIPLEKYIAWFFEILGLGSQYDHNTFDPSKYPFDNHNIVDGVLTDKALFEFTNPKETTFLSDDIVREKLEYFTRKDPTHRLLWFLVVSFAVFSDAIKQLIDKLGITLIVLNQHADNTNRKPFINRLFKSKLYHVLERLKGKKSKLNSPNLSVSTLSQYAVSSVSYRALNILNYLYQHKDSKTNSTQDDNNGTNRRFPDRPRFDNKPRFS